MGGGSHHHAWGSNRAFFVPVQQMGKLSSFQRISRNFNPNTVHVPKISAKLGRGTITCNRLYKKFPAWLYYGYRGYHASSYEFLENLREQKSWKPSQFVGPGLTEAQVLWTGKRAPFNYIQQWRSILVFWGHFTKLVIQQRFEGSAFVTCVASWSNALINLKLQHPPPSYATHGHLTVFSCQLSVPGGWEIWTVPG